MVEPITKPMPMLSAGNGVRRVGRLYQDSVVIFIHDRALDDILDYSHQDLRCEIGGFLVGGFYQERQPYIEIQHYLPALDARSKAASLTFTHETWAQVNRDIHTKYPDQRILGWHHTHPGFGLFLSEYDQFIHRNFFAEPWQVAMVVDPRQREFVFYQWRNERLVDCGFVCVADNSSV